MEAAFNAPRCRAEMNNNESIASVFYLCECRGRWEIRSAQTFYFTHEGMRSPAAGLLAANVSDCCDSPLYCLSPVTLTSTTRTPLTVTETTSLKRVLGEPLNSGDDSEVVLHRLPDV